MVRVSQTGSNVSFGKRVFSFFKNLGFISKPLGTLWKSRGASDAHAAGELRSQGSGKPLRIAFRNLSSVPLLLCWVGEDSVLHHFYKLQPSLLSKFDEISEGDHIEQSVGGHAFCFACIPEEEIAEAQKSKQLKDQSAIIGGYRAFEDCEPNSIHLVTVSRVEKSEERCCQPMSCLRKRKIPKKESSNRWNQKNDCWLTQAKIAKIDPQPFDTTEKFYEFKLLGDWPCYLEPNWNDGDKKLEQQLAKDLMNASKCLPIHASEYLKANCPIWVNLSLKYGPRAIPVTARGCCYHPDVEWLRENGLREDKHLCVEINNGAGYTKNLDLWGPGGVMVHELSHAYHHRMLPDGYDNKEVKDCYEAAMKEGLYDLVRVHGVQGPTSKAYAASNCMEYFAELSTAFLGGTNEKEEYNKWFPFNRKQIKEHDPRAYEMLKKVWKVDE